MLFKNKVKPKSIVKQLLNCFSLASVLCAPNDYFTKNILIKFCYSVTVQQKSLPLMPGVFHCYNLMNKFPILMLYPNFCNFKFTNR